MLPIGEKQIWIDGKPEYREIYIQTEITDHNVLFFRLNSEDDHLTRLHFTKVDGLGRFVYPKPPIAKEARPSDLSSVASIKTVPTLFDGVDGVDLSPAPSRTGAPKRFKIVRKRVD